LGAHLKARLVQAQRVQAQLVEAGSLRRISTSQ